MENKILFINACVRDDSRTAELSRHLLERLEGETAEVNLYKEHILPLDGKGLEKSTCKCWCRKSILPRRI